MTAKPFHRTGRCTRDCGEVHTFDEAVGLNQDHPLLTAVAFARKHELDVHQIVARQALYEQVPWAARLSPRAFESAVREFSAWTEGRSIYATWDAALDWAAKVRAGQLWSEREQFTPGRADHLFWEAG